jgi:hypothetical protein
MGGMVLNSLSNFTQLLVPSHSSSLPEVQMHRYPLHELLDPHSLVIPWEFPNERLSPDFWIFRTQLKSTHATVVRVNRF